MYIQRQRLAVFGRPFPFLLYERPQHSTPDFKQLSHLRRETRKEEGVEVGAVKTRVRYLPIAPRKPPLLRHLPLYHLRPAPALTSASTP